RSGAGNAAWRHSSCLRWRSVTPRRAPPRISPRARAPRHPSSASSAPNTSGASTATEHGSRQVVTASTPLSVTLHARSAAFGLGSLALWLRARLALRLGALDVVRHDLEQVGWALFFAALAA